MATETPGNQLKPPRPGDVGYKLAYRRWLEARLRLALSGETYQAIATFVEHNSHLDQGTRFGPQYCLCSSCVRIAVRISRYIGVELAPALAVTQYEYLPDGSTRPIFSPPPRAPKDDRAYKSEYNFFLERMGIGLAGKQIQQRINEVLCQLALYDEGEVRRMMTIWHEKGYTGEMSLVVRYQSGEIVGFSNGAQTDDKPIVLVESSELYKEGRRSLFPVVYQNDFPPMVQSFMGKPVQEYFGTRKEAE